MNDNEKIDNQYAEKEAELLEKIIQDILADEENLHYFLLPLLLQDIYNTDRHIMAHFEWQTYIQDLKENKEEFNKYKERLKQKISFNYIYACSLLFTNTANARASEMILTYLRLLYDIDQIQDAKVRKIKLLFLQSYINEKISSIGDIFLTTINGFKAIKDSNERITTANDEEYSKIINSIDYETFKFDDTIKSKDDILAFLKKQENNEKIFYAITRKLEDFSDYLLGTETDKQTIADYENRFAESKESYTDKNNVVHFFGIFYVNIYTNYDLKTDDGSKNFENKMQAVQEKYDELWQLIYDKKEPITLEEIAKILSFKADEAKLLNDSDEIKEENLPTLKPIKSGYGLINIDRLTSNLPNIINEQEMTITKTAGGDIAFDNELKVSIQMSKEYLKKAKLVFENPLNMFDISILEALQQILNDGNISFDVMMIKEKIIHKTDIRRRDDELTADIIDSVEKMRKTDLTMDISQELNKTFKKELTDEELNELAGKNEEYDEYSRTGTILDLDIIKVIKGGQKQESYIFNKKPNYFVYTEARGQQITYKASEYMLTSGITNKDDVIIARELIKRIEDLKSIPETIKQGKGKRWKKNTDGKTKYELYPNFRKIVIDSFLEDTGVLPKAYKKKLYIADENLTAEENEAKKKDHDKNEEIAEKKYYTNYRVRKARIIDKIKSFLQTFKNNKAIKDYEIYNNKNEKVEKDKTGTYVRAIGIKLEKFM